MLRIPPLRPFLTVLFGGLALATLVSATSIRPPSFEELVDQSGRIVRATVEDIRPYVDEHNGEKIVRTEVTLNVLESIDGRVPTGELKIRYLGGQVGDLRLEVGAMPKFEPGSEVVLFLHPHDRFICPTVGWGHGKYQVDRSRADGVARVRRSNGEFLQGMDQVSQPIHAGPVRTQSFDPLSQSDGMTLSQFRQLVRQQFEFSRRQE
jgi:hypothetical protein